MTSLIKSIQENIQTYLNIILADMRREYSEKGTVDTSAGCFVAFFHDGTTKSVSEKEMQEITSRDATNRSLVMTMYFWVVQSGDAYFACCELSSVNGIQLGMVTKINAKEHEANKWMEADDAGGPFKEYFDGRRAIIGQAIESKRAKDTFEEHGIDASVSRWTPNCDSEKYGAN